MPTPRRPTHPNRRRRPCRSDWRSGRVPRNPKRDDPVRIEHREYFGEDPDSNSFQFDDVFAGGALFKHGNLEQGICGDPGRDVVGVYFSTNGHIAPYGEDRMPGFIRRAAKLLAGG